MTYVTPQVTRRVPTVLPILEHGWFLHQIDSSESQFRQLKQSTGTNGERISLAHQWGQRIHPS